MKTAPLTTRGNRSPPFVIVGLVVALCIMSFYYWRVSSRNSELEMQLETQRTVIRNEISKRGNADKRTETIMGNLKACEDDMQKDKMILIEKENNIKSLNDQVHAKTEEADNKRKECDTNLQTCQVDTNGVRQELQKLKEDATKREEELKSLKDAASPNQNCNCDAALQEQRKNIENVLLKTVGEQAVTALRQNDQGKAAGDAQAPQQPQQQEQPQAQQQAPPQPQLGGGFRTIVGQRQYVNRFGNMLQFSNQRNRNGLYHNPDAAAVAHANQGAVDVVPTKDGKIPVDGQGGVPAQVKDSVANADNPAAANGEAGIRHGADDANGNAIDTEARNKDTADREGKDGGAAKDGDVNDDSDGDVVGKSSGNLTRALTTTTTTKSMTPTLSDNEEGAKNKVEGVNTDNQDQKVIDDAQGGGPLKFEPESKKESDDEIDDLEDN